MANRELTGRLQRWLHLLTDVRAGRAGTTSEMARRYGVTSRTINKDIQELTAAGIPLYYDRSQHRYAFPGNIYMPPVTLDLPEFCVVQLLLTALQDNAGLGNLREKLERLYPGCLRPNTQDTPIAVRVTQSIVDSTVIQTIHEAIARKMKLKFTYSMPGNPKPFRIYVDPHGICFVRHAWYIAAWYPPHERIQFYRINRMTEPEILDKPFTPQSGFDLEAILADAWSIFYLAEPQHVVVRFSARVAPYIQEVDWHHSQKISENFDGSITFEVDVSDIREIRFWALQYGADAEIISPPELRESMIREITGMAAVYHQQE